MSEIVKQDDENQASKEFASGFEGVAPPEKAAEPEPKPEAKTEATVKTGVVKTPPAPAPEYIQITKAEWESVKGAASKMLTADKVKDMILGTVGEQEQRLVRKLQAATPSGASVEIPADAFADMEKDYPDLAKQMRQVLTKSLKGIRGTGPADPKAGLDPDELKKSIIAEAKKIAVAQEEEALKEEHPDWREIVGLATEKDNEFRKWLAAQGPVYEGRINNASKAAPIAKAIDRFLASKAALTRQQPKPPAKQTQQSERIRSAIQPKGDGGQPPPAKTADDDFRAGFASG